MRRKKIHGITLGLLSPLKLAGLSYGEVTEPKTFDAISQQPITGGLFCPRIFGPTEAGKCRCGRHRGQRKKGVVCERCGVEAGDPAARKERLGHVTLASPVVHPWFRSAVALLLAIPPKQLERIVLCMDYIVLARGLSPYQQGNVIRFQEYLRHKDHKGFEADTGGSALRHLLRHLDLDALIAKLRHAAPSRRSSKRLIAARDLWKSGNRPEWMIPDLLPVLPPALRPIVFLEDGTVASSGLNDLYRKVITRNNRLRKYRFAGAPEVVLNNEKRLLQEAVDALLKSLSDILHTKQGRLRRNLLGKRVDYSGRSVIVPGPELHLDQCGIPKEMAMDMFRPFIYGRLLRAGRAGSLRHARTLVDSRSDEAFGALEKVMKRTAVLLNRAPSLHRMNMQAFSPVLAEGLAVRLHPLVCAAFNADFDGDQMGVHIPVSYRAQLEARTVMLSVHNVFSPAHGGPIIFPSQDIVLGIYYLTREEDGRKGDGMLFSDKDDAVTACQHGIVEEQARIRLRLDGRLVGTTAGRVIFSSIFPGRLPFELFNRTIRKKDLNALIEICSRTFGPEEAVLLLDRIKETGFRYATLSGISVCVDDMAVPEEKREIVSAAEEEVRETEDMFRNGLITPEDRHSRIIGVWNAAAERITGKIAEGFGRPGAPDSLFLMADSGARGSLQQIRQIAGMRGLMAKPTGEIVEIPVKSSLREGQTCFEFLLSSHGARKGRADGALRTSVAGYFTRRLVDAAGDIVIEEEDCGTADCITVMPLSDGGELLVPLEERVYGRAAAQDIAHPETGEVIVGRNEVITREAAEALRRAGVPRAGVRSPVTCRSKKGVCALCYGHDLSRRAVAAAGDPVGVIAAQSIGEPGTQLTLRTFHSGGSVSGTFVEEGGRAKVKDITYGLPRVLQILEARPPELPAVLAEISGRLTVLPAKGKHIPFRITGGDRITREYTLPAGRRLRAGSGDEIKAGDVLACGVVDARDLLRIWGPKEAALHIVDEVQKVYRLQGVSIHDKHIEIITRKMLGMVMITDPGDTGLVHGEPVSRNLFFERNENTPGKKAAAMPLLVGITDAALNSESWLSAASFQRTASVLARAALRRRTDPLSGPKENIIVGSIIPVGTGFKRFKDEG